MMDRYSFRVQQQRRPKQQEAQQQQQQQQQQQAPAGAQRKLVSLSGRQRKSSKSSSSNGNSRSSSEIATPQDENLAGNRGKGVTAIVSPSPRSVMEQPTPLLAPRAASNGAPPRHFTFDTPTRTHTRAHAHTSKRGSNAAVQTVGVSPSSPMPSTTALTESSTDEEDMDLILASAKNFDDSATIATSDTDNLQSHTFDSHDSDSYHHHHHQDHLRSTVLHVQDCGATEAALRRASQSSSRLLIEPTTPTTQPKKFTSLSIFTTTLCAVPTTLSDAAAGVTDIINPNSCAADHTKDSRTDDQQLDCHNQDHHTASCHSCLQHTNQPQSSSSSVEQRILAPSFSSCTGDACLASPANTPTSTPNDDQQPDQADFDKRRQNVERTISSFLSSPGSWCDGWHAWSLTTVHDHGTMVHPRDLRRVLRNRAGDLNAQARRIQRLKDNLSPFDVARNNSFNATSHGRQSTALELNSRRNIDVQKAHSFSYTDRISAHSPSMPSRPSSPTTDISSSVVSMTSSVFESIPGCGDSSREDSAAKLVVDDPFAEEDLCYDSDPGETDAHAYRRRVAPTITTSADTLLQQKSRHVVDAFLRNGVWTEHDVATSYSDTHIQKEWKAVSHPNRPYRAPELHLCHEGDITKNIEEIMNRRMTLIWHQCSVAEDAPNPKQSSPIAVMAWVELGSQLRTALIHPKIMWKPVRDREDMDGRMGLTNLNLDSVDLLDISRILEVRSIDRSKYPLAKRRCSFIIETLDRTVLFEASTEPERNRIVYGLKLVVARLGSKIIMGDDRVFEEFFTPFGASVPGAAPLMWTR